MSEDFVYNEDEESGKGGQGNKNALAYGLLAGAGVNTEGMSPTDAWALVDELKLLDRKSRAKTDKEKKEYKQKNVDSKKKGITKDTVIKNARKIAKSVALHTDNVAGINEAINTISRAIEEFNLNKLDRIGTKKHIGQGIYSAAAEANGAMINIGREFLRNPSAFYRSAVEDYGGETLKDIKSYESMLKDNSLSQIARSSIEDSLKDLRKRVPYDRHNVCYKGQEVESIITHELGHVIADQYCGLTNGNKYLLKGVGHYKAQKKRDLIERVYQESLRNGDIFKISEYAAQNSHEFFAETFCMYKMKRETLPANIKSMIEGVLKR